MKAMARSFVYWLKIERDIEKIAQSCQPCLRNRDEPPRARLTPWPLEQSPWERIHMDYCELRNQYFLIIVDSYTKWVEAFPTPNMSAETTIGKLWEVFTRFGLPKTIVSDNAANFQAESLRSFLQRNGIDPVTWPPYHPQSNGQVENAVKTFKKKLKTMLSDPKYRNMKLPVLVQQLLCIYRTSEHCSTKQTPSRLMFGREVRNRFSLLREKKHQGAERKIGGKESEENRRATKQYGGKRRSFEAQQEVMVRDYRVGSKIRWAKATVIRALGRSTYVCRTEEGLEWKRHTDQIIPRAEEAEAGAEPGLTTKGHIRRRRVDHADQIIYLPVESPSMTRGVETATGVEGRCQPGAASGATRVVAESGLIAVHYDKPSSSKTINIREGNKNVESGRESAGKRAHKTHAKKRQRWGSNLRAT